MDTRKSLNYKADLAKHNALIVNKHLPFIFLAILFFINILIFWPGQMSPDSISQYGQALSGKFSDHHPPIMAAMWRIFSNIYPGQAPIFVFHITLLYFAALIFMITFRNTKLIWYYLFYPLFLPILLYSSMIWKDVGFAYCYLLLCSILTYCILNKKKPGYAAISIILLILFYATAVKFQAKFISPIIVLWVSYILNNFKFNIKTIFYAIFGSIALLASINFFDYNILKTENSNSWKFVKIYDLAGISIKLDKPIFPKYILEYENFSFDLVKQKFNYERVDDIVFFKDSPIPRIETVQNRAELLSLWRKTVIQHPIAYIRHRFYNWKRILFAKPLEKLETLNFKEHSGLSWFVAIQQNQTLGKFIFLFLKFIRHIFSFPIVLSMLMAYFIISINNYKNRYGIVLLMISSIALSLVLALFPFSMASSLRYVYMSVCLTHACHPIAYMIYKKT